MFVMGLLSGIIVGVYLGPTGEKAVKDWIETAKGWFK